MAKYRPNTVAAQLKAALTPYQYRQAYKAIREEEETYGNVRLLTECDTPTRALLWAFVWFKTPQKDSYWRNIYLDLCKRTGAVPGAETSLHFKQKIA